MINILNRKIVNWIAAISGGVLFSTVVSMLLIHHSTIQNIQTLYENSQFDQVAREMESLPPAVILDNDHIRFWNCDNYTFIEGQFKLYPLGENARLCYQALSPSVQGALTLLFVLFAFFFLLRYALPLTRGNQYRLIVIQAGISLSGVFFLWLLGILWGQQILPFYRWILIWGSMCLILFSSSAHASLSTRHKDNTSILLLSMTALGLSTLVFFAIGLKITSDHQPTPTQFDIWTTKILLVWGIIAFQLLLTRILHTCGKSMKGRISYLGILGLVLLLLFTSFSSIYFAILFSIVSLMSYLLMDLTVEEKRINFLWMVTWILLTSIILSILWMSQQNLNALQLIDFFNYLSLSFVGNLLLLVIVLCLNTLLNTRGGWRSMKIPKNLLLRNKIELITLGTLVIAFTTIGLMTYLLEKSRQHKIVNEQLGAIQYGAPSDFILQDGFEMKRFSKEDLYWDPRNRFHLVDLPPYLAWERQKDLAQPIIYKDQAIWKESAGTLAAFRPIRQPFIASFGDSLISKLFNIYVFLFLICLGLVYIMAQSMTRPLALLGEKLEQISLGRSNPKIEWKDKDEIGQLIQRYNTMLEQLDHSAEALAHNERDMAWKEMAKQVAHEIKNPLTPMRLAIQHLQMQAKASDHPLTQQVDKTANTLIEQIDNMTRIAENFSQFGSLPQHENERVLLNDIVTSVHDLFRKREDMDIKCRVPIDDCYVFADKDHLIRIFNNIIKNAIQAIPRDRTGQIMIKLTREAHNALVSISDNGEGIPDDRIKKVFQPNFTTKRSGTGLGLAMCSKMIESMDGKIYFETEVDNGTTFFVEIPLMRIEENYS